jgi:beta-lactamase class A
MKRALFLGGLAATIARPASARGIAVADLVRDIPGITGVYARTMAPGAPIVRIRDGEPFASASIIKLPIMVTAFRAFDTGTASPDDVVRLRAEDMIGGSDALAHARPGDRYRLRDLITAMIRVSDNTAANTLITALSFGSINSVIREAGMTGTHLGRHFADVVPAWHISANVTTPRDCGTLLYAIERGAREGLDTVAKSASCRRMIDILLGQEDATKIPLGLPRGTPCAHKTGEIDEVRNDAAIVDPYGDSPYVLVVLTRALRDTSAGNRGIGAIAHRIDTAVRI